MKAVLIAGVASGVGKTTIATGIMGALHRRNLKVQPFKTGPDYIDPGYHTLVTGETSRNLDTYLLPHDAVIELFNRAVARKDIAVIEGVMGLYDGRYSTNEEGSTAELAKLLNVPVLLVVESRKAARSVAAVVEGYKSFDPSLNLSGVILNGIGSDKHLNLCRESIEHYTGVPVVGYLHWQNNLTLPERHLGLVPTVERPADRDFLDNLIAQCESSFDIPAILRLSEQAAPPRVEPGLFPPEDTPPTVRIAVARDKAFSFYYQDSLDLLQAWGAEIVPFSPLEDTELPRDISGIYIGGGFPEVYAAGLADNSAMRHSILEAGERGMPVYAECGGLMYLGKDIRDLEGNEHLMVGAIPVSSQINEPRLTLGYRTVRALSDGPLLRRGETVRGHEFHWSVADSSSEMNAYQIEDGEQREGFHIGNIFASYIHLHMGSRHGMAQRFIEVCQQQAGALNKRH
jgi:cobyrinic acid a,c-diamide synthase